LNIDNELLRKSEDEYGENYHAHYLDIYKLYVDMADRISTRRQSANSFFLTVNTAIIAIASYIQLGADKGKSADFYWLISIAGMALCFMWYRLIRSYKDLNSGKFKVVHRIEQNLPIAPYDAEWEALGRGKSPKLYLPFTRVEIGVPWVFFALHFLVFARCVPWKIIWSSLPFTS
jgi:hypothetical protein